MREKYEAQVNDSSCSVGERRRIVGENALAYTRGSAEIAATAAPATQTGGQLPTGVTRP